MDLKENDEREPQIDYGDYGSQQSPTNILGTQIKLESPEREESEALIRNTIQKLTS